MKDRKINFVYICTLCNLTINTPCRTSKCDHVFCSDCITIWLKDNNQCPFKCSSIRHDDFYYISKKELNATSAPFKCPKYSYGCRKILSKTEFQFHLQSECQFNDQNFESAFQTQKEQESKCCTSQNLKQYNSNCFLDLSPLSNFQKTYQQSTNIKGVQQFFQHQEGGIKSPGSLENANISKSTIPTINKTSNTNGQDLNNSSLGSLVGLQNIPDESETTADFFPAFPNASLEQIQMTEMSKTIIFLNDQLRKFISFFVFQMKSKSNLTSPFESLLEKNDLYFSQLEQKVEQIRKKYLKTDQLDKQIIDRHIELKEIQNVARGEQQLNAVEAIKCNLQQLKLHNNSLKHKQKQNTYNHQQFQQDDNQDQNQTQNEIYLNQNQEEQANNSRMIRKINISLLSNQENNPSLSNQGNNKKTQKTSTSHFKDYQKTQKVSMVSNGSQSILQYENLQMNSKGSQANNLQQRKNSSYSDLKKVQKITFEKSGQQQATGCNLNTRYSLKSWRKQPSRENIRLNTQEQYSENNTQMSSPRIDLSKTAKTQQTSRNSINVLSFPLQFYNESCEQQDAQQKVNVVSLQSIQEQFTSRFEQHGISAQSGEDCRNLDTEEFSSQKIQTKNFSINRNQLDAKENGNFDSYCNTEQKLIVNSILQGNETFQQYQKNGNNFSQSLENGEENINDITQIDMQNTNTTIHFLKACKSTLNNSLDLKQSYQTQLNPKHEKQIIQQLELDPKYSNKNIKENDIRYIVNAKWWRSWIQYVSFYEKESNTESSDHSNVLSKRLSVNYERPSYINNKELTKDCYLFENYPNLNTNLLSLKDNLLEHHDYVILTKPVFLQLKKWYNVDVIIPRFIKFDSFERMLYVELYPEKNYQTRQSSRSNSNNERKYKSNAEPHMNKLSIHQRNNTSFGGNGSNNLKQQVTRVNSKDEFESQVSNPIRYASQGSLKCKGGDQQNQIETEGNYQQDLLTDEDSKQCRIF